jgi:hypothetical protein
METESSPKYSTPFYYNYHTKDYVDQNFTPTKLPVTKRPLHGGEYGFDTPVDDQDKHEESRESKFIKYKGLQLKDDLSIATFQRFKAEWEAYLNVNTLTNKQIKEQLVDRALAGNAKLIASQAFQDRFGEASAQEILQLLDNKINAHLGLRGKVEMIKKIQQNTKEESLINLFLSLDLAFASRPNTTQEDKILSAFEAIKSRTLANNIAKREREFAGDWIKLQQIASEEWGFMGGKDNEPDQIAVLQSQLNAIQEQSSQLIKEHQRIIQKQNEQIHAISQKSTKVRECFKCGKLGHIRAECRTKDRSIKKICKLHGENYSHSSAECKLLDKPNQATLTRDSRQPFRRVRFEQQAILPNVSTNNKDLSKYNRVIRFVPSESDAKDQIQDTNNLFQSQPNSVWSTIKNGKVLSEPSTILNVDKAMRKVEERKYINRRTKNTKTNSSSLYIHEMLEDQHAKVQNQENQYVYHQKKVSKIEPAKWRKPKQVNSILDIEILRVKGRLNNILNQEILVDTGARSNVIRKDVVQKLQATHQIVPTNIELTAANNSSLRVLGKIKLAMNWEEERTKKKEEDFNYTLYQSQVNSINSLQVNFQTEELSISNSDQFQVEFIVVDQLSVPVILGTKGIKEMKMKIDFEAEEIIVNEKNYPFINTQRSTTLHTTKKATIPPLSIHTIEIEGELSQAIYSIEEYYHNTPIQIIESGFTAKDGKNKFKIWIKNLDREEYVIPANSTIAVARNPTPISIIKEPVQPTTQIQING